MAELSDTPRMTSRNEWSGGTYVEALLIRAPSTARRRRSFSFRLAGQSSKKRKFNNICGYGGIGSFETERCRWQMKRG